MYKLILPLYFIIFISTALATDEFACVDTDQGNLRTGPGTSNPVISKMNKYTPVKILEEKSGWFKIQSRFETGWLHESLIMKSAKCAQALTTIKTHLKPSPYSEHHPKKEKVYLNEGLFILEDGMGVTKVKDKHGRIFWVNSDKLWPTSEAAIQL